MRITPLLFVASIIASLCGAAHAAPAKLVVLEAIGPLDAPRLAALTDRARGAALSAWPDVLVMTPDTLEALLPPGVALADCDDECEADAGRRVGADWVLTLRIGGVSAPHTVTANVLSTADRVLVGQGVAQANDQQLLDAIAQAVQQAIASHRAQDGPPRRVVQAEPVDQPGPRQLQVSAPHPMTVLAGGQVVGEAPVSVPLGRRATIDIELRAPRRLPARLRVHVGAKSGRIAVELTQALGVLDLSALRTPWLRDARVELDGMPLPRHTNLTLRQGRYRLRLRHPCAQPKPVVIQVRGGARVNLPLGALLTCRVVRLTTDYADSVLFAADAPVALPYTVLVPPAGRTVHARIGGQDIQTFEIPGDAPAQYTLSAKKSGYQVVIHGRFRNGARCFEPLEIDSEPVGTLPWTGTLKRGPHQVKSRCRVDVARRINVQSPTKLYLREPFGDVELVVGMAENFSLGTVGARWWIPFLEGAPLRIGLGAQVGYAWDEEAVLPGIELLFAIPGRYVDVILAPVVSNHIGGMRLIARMRAGPVPIDVGWGISAQPDGDDSIIRNGLFLGTGVVF